jgi:hypothetical protein
MTTAKSRSFMSLFIMFAGLTLGVSSAAYAVRFLSQSSRHLLNADVRQFALQPQPSERKTTSGAPWTPPAFIFSFKSDELAKFLAFVKSDASNKMITSLGSSALRQRWISFRPAACRTGR